MNRMIEQVNGRSLRGTVTVIILAVPFFIGILSRIAWAVQHHGGAEGLVSHQIGHILFISGMIFMLFRVYVVHAKGRGWFEFKAFLWLIILWNCLTFTGHWMREYVDPKKFIKVGAHTIGYSIEGLWDLIFYMSRLDNVLLVPAFLFLLLALNRWRRYS